MNKWISTTRPMGFCSWYLLFVVHVNVEGRTGGARICVPAWNAVVTAKSEKAGPGLWNPMETLQRFRFVGKKTFTSRRLFPMERWYTNYYTYLVDHSPFPWNAGLYWCFGPVSRSVCELCFSRLLLPESHARCILIQIGTPVLYEVNTRSIRGLPWVSGARLLHWSWHYWFFLPHLLVLKRHISDHLLYLRYVPFILKH